MPKPFTKQEIAEIQTANLLMSEPFHSELAIKIYKNFNTFSEQTTYEEVFTLIRNIENKIRS